MIPLIHFAIVWTILSAIITGWVGVVMTLRDYGREDDADLAETA